MKKMKWINAKNMPIKLPIYQTAVVWLLLDRTQAAGWIHGAAWTFMGILWIAVISLIATSERMEEMK